MESLTARLILPRPSKGETIRDIHEWLKQNHFDRTCACLQDELQEDQNPGVAAEAEEALLLVSERRQLVLSFESLPPSVAAQRRQAAREGTTGPPGFTAADLCKLPDKAGCSNPDLLQQGYQQGEIPDDCKSLSQTSGQPQNRSKQSSDSAAETAKHSPQDRTDEVFSKIVPSRARSEQPPPRTAGVEPSRRASEGGGGSAPQPELLDRWEFGQAAYCIAAERREGGMQPSTLEPASPPEVGTVQNDQDTAATGGKRRGEGASREDKPLEKRARPGSPPARNSGRAKYTHTPRAQVLCKFYAAGSCRNGADCGWSHDSELLKRMEDARRWASPGKTLPLRAEDPYRRLHHRHDREDCRPVLCKHDPRWRQEERSRTAPREIPAWRPERHSPERGVRGWERRPWREGPAHRANHSMQEFLKPRRIADDFLSPSRCAKQRR